MKNSHKGRLPPFVPVFRETLESKAWKAMSFGARLLFISLKSFYNYKSDNNGKLFLPHRKAADLIGADKSHVARWFRELEFYGFIVKTKRAYLGFEGKGQAPRWRLTEIGLRDGQRPTHEFLFWDGTPFTDQSQRNKFRIPSAKSGQGVRKKRTVVSAKSGQSDGKVSAKSGQITGTSPSAKSGQNNYLPLGWRVGGALDEEEATDLTLPLMSVVEGGKGGSRTAGSSEVCAHCGRNGEAGQIFKYKQSGSRPVWLHRPCRLRYWQTHGAAS